MLEQSFVVQVGEFIKDTMKDIDRAEFPSEYELQLEDFRQLVKYLYKLGMIDLLQYDYLFKRIDKHTTDA